MNNENILSYVQGNDVVVDVRLFENTKDGTGIVEQPFDLTSADGVTCRIDGFGDIEYRLNAEASNSLILQLPHTLPKGKYNLEICTGRGGMRVRSFELSFHVVGTNSEARSTLTTIGSQSTGSLRVTFQMVPQAAVRGRDAIDEWLALPENQGKTREDFVVEVLDLYGRAASLQEAIAIATHPDHVGADNFVYHWQNGAYVKTDIYVKGAKGDAFTYNDFTSEQLAALKGAKGDAFTYNDFTPEQLAALKGAKGDAFTYNDFTPEQLAALKGAKGDAFTYNDFTPEQLAALKGDPSSADISLVGTVVTVTNNAGQSSSCDLSAILGDVNSVLDNINGEVI